MISSSRKLQGKGFETGTQACDGFGLLLVAVLWTGKSACSFTGSLTRADRVCDGAEHFWTFSLAFATYMILIYVSRTSAYRRVIANSDVAQPLSRITRILERRWYFLYLIIWGLAFGLAVLTYELYGYWACESASRLASRHLLSLSCHSRRLVLLRQQRRSLRGTHAIYASSIGFRFHRLLLRSTIRLPTEARQDQGQLLKFRQKHSSAAIRSRIYLSVSHKFANRRSRSTKRS